MLKFLFIFTIQKSKHVHCNVETIFCALVSCKEKAQKIFDLYSKYPMKVDFI